MVGDYPIGLFFYKIYTINGSEMFTMDQAMHSEFQDVTRDIDLGHGISFRTNIYLSSGLLNT